MEYTASAFWRQGRVGLRDVAFVVVATIKKEQSDKWSRNTRKYHGASVHSYNITKTEKGAMTVIFA